jgi:Phosphotransferase enzyme family
MAVDRRGGARPSAHREKAMTETSRPAGRRPRSARDVFADPSLRGVLISASRDPDAKLTFIVPPQVGASHSGPQSTVALKIPATVAAGLAVEREGRMLVDLRRSQLGELAATIPRYVETLDLDGRPVLMSTAMPGTQMSVTYHQWLHTARPQRVAADFSLAGDWLRRFQAATARTSAPIDWVTEVCADLRGRWDAHPCLDAALTRLATADERFSIQRAPRTAVHGDFWFGNLLLTDGRISGVIDWEGGTPDGSPLRDLVRFALSYSLYLDRHTRPGHRVLGHPRLRREGFAPGIRYALLERGWLPGLVRSFLRDGLAELGLPRELWYDAALTGIGEVAALANDDAFGRGHLELLAGLPQWPRRHRQGWR